MERRTIRILIVLALLVLVLLAIGWVGFILLGLPSGKALSATINVLSSVGLGSPPLDTSAGWVLVGLLQFGSVGIVTLAVAALSQVIIAGAMKQYMGRRRMDERIKKLKDHSIIVGYSLTGEDLARDFIAEGWPFVIIECDPEKITLLEEIGILYVEGDATHEEVLKSAGVEHAMALFSVLADDSNNVMVVLSARGLNPDIKIVSRSTRDDYKARFIRAGANVAISPQEWASRRMAQAVFRPHLLEVLSMFLDPAIACAYMDEIRVPEGSPIIGKKLADSGIRQTSGIFLMGIARESGEYVILPGPDTEIEKGDVLIGFGERSSFTSLEKFVQPG